MRRTRSARADRPAHTADTRALRLSGKRIGFAAIALAVLVPAALPAMEPVSFFSFGVGGNGSRRRRQLDQHPEPDRQPEGPAGAAGATRTVLTYTNSDNQPRYLRIYSLDTFDGDQFGDDAAEGRAGEPDGERPAAAAARA